MTKAELQTYARRVFDPIVGALAALGVPPLFVSMVGLALSLYGALLLANDRLPLSGLILLLAGLMDVLDGDLARRRGVSSRFGAFIDSTLDRVTEFAYFGGILLYIARRPGGYQDWEILVAFVALAGSVLTSYARARAEGLGIDCKVGLMERPERIAALALGLLVGYRLLIVIMGVLAVTTLATFVHRVVHVYRQGRGADSPPEPDHSPD